MAAHEHERWQIMESANGGHYCGVCGEHLMVSFTASPSPSFVPESIRDFRQAFPVYVLAWQRYPDISPALDELTDRVACRQMSELFREVCLAHGDNVNLVHGVDAGGMVYEHWWTVLRVGNLQIGVDWTARQFHNLEHPPNPAHADLPTPYTWDVTRAGSFKHPLVDFTTITVTR